MLDGLSNLNTDPDTVVIENIIQRDIDSRKLAQSWLLKFEEKGIEEQNLAFPQ